MTMEKHIDELQRRIARETLARHEAQKKNEELEEKLGELEKQISSKGIENQEIGRQLIDATKELDIFRAKSSTLESQLNETKQELETYRTGKSMLDNQLNEANKELETYRAGNWAMNFLLNEAKKELGKNKAGRLAMDILLFNFYENFSAVYREQKIRDIMCKYWPADNMVQFIGNFSRSSLMPNLLNFWQDIRKLLAKNKYACNEMGHFLRDLLDYREKLDSPSGSYQIYAPINKTTIETFPFVERKHIFGREEYPATGPSKEFGSKQTFSILGFNMYKKPIKNKYKIREWFYMGDRLFDSPVKITEVLLPGLSNSENMNLLVPPLLEGENI